MENLICTEFCDVFTGLESLNQLRSQLHNRYSDSSKFILTDSNVRRHSLPLLHKILPESENFRVIEIPAGESNKELGSCSLIWSALTKAGAGRDSLLLSLGGGMICDLGGFAAATYMRGICHILIPTSLLAMVDASTGGKTGINFNGLKNQLGVFSNPEAVYLYLPFLETLPEREFNSGLAEVIKHALIADAGLWHHLLKGTDFAEADLEQLVRRSIVIKNDIVSTDRKDLHLRHSLNFGHTIGHARESISIRDNGDSLRHGEAIAFGMIAESYLSHLLAGLSHTELTEITDYISSRYNYINTGFDPECLIPLIISDKKNISGQPNFSLIPSIGKVEVNRTAGKEEILESVNYTLNAFSKAAV
jgi:3-dehydroquinate synthase